MLETQGWIRRLSLALQFVALLWCSGASAQALVHFDLPAQPMAKTLKAIGAATNTDIGFKADEVAGINAPAMQADLTVDGALTRVLAGTRLKARHLDGHTIVIALKESSAVSRTEGQAGARETATAQGLAQSNSPDESVSSGEHKKYLDEIVVTGSNIRGATDSASPLKTYSAEDIQRSGQPTLAAFMQTLPQNFGGTSEFTIAGVGSNSATDNSISGNAADLHGLGNDATVTLINGHRIAPSGSDGNVVDISMIPMNAVERIEVLTDGASAIYGSDAVGGVVNIILKKNFEGAETSARYGAVSQGSSHDTQFGQTFGSTWGGGSGLVSYEFYDRTPLSAANRSYSSSTGLPFTLLPEQMRQSVFVTANQLISPRLAVFADGEFSRRSTDIDVTVPGSYSEHVPSHVAVYGATVGGKYSLSDSTEATLSAGYTSSESHQDLYQDPVPPALTLSDLTVSHTRLLTVDGVVRGSLWALPAGDILYAAGGQYRSEAFDQVKPLVPARFNPDRHIGAAFAELRVPLVGAAGSGSAANRLELSIADRDEHYSDFGSSNNPKVGLLFRVVPEVKVRGTYGTSFVAPQLQELNPIPRQVAAFNTGLFPGASPPGGDINVLLVAGGNSQLTAQKAKTWTLGADLTALDEAGVSASVTYYGTTFTNRINTLTSAGINPCCVVPQAALYGPQIVQLNPPAALAARYINTPGFANLGADLSSGIQAIIYGNYLNISDVKTSGIDFDVAYRKATPIADLETGLAGTYIFRYDENLSATYPTTSILNTQYDPLRFKARGRVALSRGSLTSSAFVNYTNAYHNASTTPSTQVASWTTIDFTTRYACQACAGVMGHLAATFAVLNLANRNPPFLANPFGFGINFDGSNANPLGRYFSLQFAASW